MHLHASVDAGGLDYPVTYQPELAPSWLGHIAIRAGIRAPDWTGPFTVLELGCGRGLSSALHAAAFPAGRFIACEADHTLVFVEVKTRTGNGFGGLEQAVTPQKLRRIRRLAGIWLAAQERGWPGLRIDVVAVEFEPGVRRPSAVRHYERAVGAG